MAICDNYDRKLYEDKKAMNQYRDVSFGGRKTTVDEITGVVLHRDDQMARNKYGLNTDAEGKKIWARHAQSVDHRRPLKSIHETVSKIPVLRDTLTDEDIKEVANKSYNFEMRARGANSAKGDKTNYEVGINAIKDGKIKEGFKQIKSGITADAHIAVGLTQKAGERLFENAEKKIDDTSKTIKNIAGKENAPEAIQSASEAIKSNGSLQMDAKATTVGKTKEKESDKNPKENASAENSAYSVGGLSFGGTDYLNANAKFTCSLLGGVPFNVIEMVNRSVTANGACVLTNTAEILPTEAPCPKLTAAAGGTPVPCACQRGPWQNADSKAKICSLPALTKKSTAVCLVGQGVMKVLSAGVSGKFVKQ